MDILAATGNRGKADEIEHILNSMLPDIKIHIKTLKDFPGFIPAEEDGSNYHDNAMLKAQKAAVETGMVTIADDSGLEVDLLGGHPGIYSSRLAGPDATDENNIDMLLKLLDIAKSKTKKSNNNAGSKRGDTARFRSIICLVDHARNIYFSEGTCEGTIITEKRGSNGFGYDPVFFISSKNQTLAEMDRSQKNSISHRTDALVKIVPTIKKLYRLQF